jgi:hypothetical protein
MKSHAVLPIYLPKEMEVKVKGVHYKVGDTVWIPSIDYRINENFKCPCCRLPVTEEIPSALGSIDCKKIKEVRIVLTDGKPNVTYLLEDGGIRDVAHMFPTEIAAKHWTRIRVEQDNAKILKDRKKYETRIKKFIVKCKRGN